MFVAYVYFWGFFFFGGGGLNQSQMPFIGMIREDYKYVVYSPFYHISILSPHSSAWLNLGFRPWDSHCRSSMQNAESYGPLDGPNVHPKVCDCLRLTLLWEGSRSYIFFYFASPPILCSFSSKS